MRPVSGAKGPTGRIYSLQHQNRSTWNCCDSSHLQVVVSNFTAKLASYDGRLTAAAQALGIPVADL